MGTPIERLTELFGDQRAVAQAVGISEPMVTHLKKPPPRGTNGRLPAKYNLAVLSAARHRRIDEAAVLACLDPVCATCGQPLPMEG